MQSILIYGGSNSGKTSLCGQFARYQWQRHGGRQTLYVSADSGWYSCIEEVRDGCLIPYNLASHPNTLWALRRLSKGYWPAKINPYTGAAADPADFRPIPALGLEISGIAVEGLSRISELLSQTLTNDMQLSTQEPLSAQFRLKPDGSILQGLALQTVEHGDEESFSMASRGTYNFVQSQTLDYVNRFKSHPYAPRVLITAHQGEGSTTEGISARCLGPTIYGKKLVDKAPGWFSSYFHAEPIAANTFGIPCPNNCNRHPQCPVCRGLGQTGNPDCRFLWFQMHPDKAGSGLLWPAKFGGSARMTYQFRKQFPTGYIPAWIDEHGLQGGLIPFLQAFDLEEQTYGPGHLGLQQPQQAQLTIKGQTL